jgi:hypothetical protein
MKITNSLYSDCRKKVIKESKAEKQMDLYLRLDTWRMEEARGRILGRNSDKSIKSFPPCSSLLLLLTDPPPEQKSFETGCNVNIINLKSENSQDYAQKPQGNCSFMNSSSVE